MKEIGGYLELEELSGSEYYPELMKLNLGRTALLYCLEKLNVKKLWLPHFLCDSVISVCKKFGCELKWYSITENFLPDLTVTALSQNEYLFLVNYYGQISNNRIEKYKSIYHNLIVDNTHAFYQKPVTDVPTLYSCRKFFGLPDGAYLYLPGSKCEDEETELERDHSCTRMTHILGRYENPASAFYQQMLDTAHTYYQEPPKSMSRLTRNLLKGIDYEFARERRIRNYQVLASYFDGLNLLKPVEQEVPFVYPFLCSNGSQLKKQLAKEHIFVPTYWNNVISQMNGNTLEYNYASNILPLPCDQRYKPEDMEWMAQTIIKQMKGQGSAL